MTTPAPGGSSGRIVIDPDELRDLASRLKDAAILYSSVGRELATKTLPPMPTYLSAAITDSIGRVHADLHGLAIELVNEAGTLEARATWADLGGGEEVGWLVPGSRGRAQTLPPAAEEQIETNEEWAIGLLDRIHEPVGEAEGGGSDVGSVRVIEQTADEVPGKPLGGFTLTAKRALGGTPERDEDGPSPGTGTTAAEGALGVGLGTLATTPTGPGVAAFLLGAGSLVSESNEEVDGEGPGE